MQFHKEFLQATCFRGQSVGSQPGRVRVHGKIDRYTASNSSFRSLAELQLLRVESAEIE